MKFDPKRIMDEAIDQMQKREGMEKHEDRPRSSYGNDSEVDDLIYKIYRDMEDIRVKSRELSDRMSDQEMKFNRLWDLLKQRRDY
ncbi:hypothetical protein [Methanobacterium sp. ACI-7]|uniref:hypothetical protein n=1 Tax=unclassified Methanobacterium TaxID=2627676 RepID=UPI0039C22058